MSILDRMIAASLPITPKFIVRKVAARYVAGETLDQAVATAKKLNGEGAMVTFDLLGEFVTEEAEADRCAEDYLEILDRIHAEKLVGNVSIKLTAFGLKLDTHRTLDRVRRVVSRARELGNFVRIDMEDSPCTDGTLQVFRALRETGFGNVGVVLQAYLRRTSSDVSELAFLSPSYRLCKGIYVEPEAIAYKDAEEIRRNYVEVLDQMLRSGSYVGIATHDEELTLRAKEVLSRRRVARDAYEFQMLLGVTESLRRRLIAEGHRLRVYIPFGRDWYGYCLRRLKENPKIGGYVVKALFTRRT